jgi:hypothetical protein
MSEVRMDYEAVGAMAEQFATSADTLHRLNRALETAITLLRLSAFVGNVGSTALAHYLEGIQPAIMRLAGTCEELSDDLVGAIRALRDGDLSGSQRFSGQGQPGGAASGAGSMFAADASKQAVAQGNAVSLGGYQNGVNGWRLIPVSGDFTPNELVVQQGPSCTVYGAMNLLIENGYDISQTEANQLYQDQLNNAGVLSKTWFDMLDGQHDSGFPRSDALELIEQHGASYEHGDFDTGIFGWGSPDRGAAEKFLLTQVSGGNPVYVSTSTDDTFGIKGAGHAYTVLGVQQDDAGNLSNVLVSTNWSGSQQVYEIPAEAFMDNWLDHSNGEYIVITGAQ